MLNASPKTLCVGTMLKFGTPDFEEYMKFMASAGMECCQFCRISETLMVGGAANSESAKLLDQLEQYGIPPVSIFLGYGKSSGGNGLVSAELRAERFSYAFRQMLWGGRLGIKYISCHAGKFPEIGTREFDDFAKDMKSFVQFAADLGEVFLFETGPDSMEEMQAMLDAIDEMNVGINFDPANLLLYNQTDPALFAERLFPKIRLIHCKDGKRPREGQKLGDQTPLGEGDTHFVTLIRKMIDKGFRGPLILERETPHDENHFSDQKKAVNLLKQLRANTIDP